MVEVKTFVVGALETNCYLVYENEDKNAFLIDPGFFDERISETIKKKGLSVKAIINTHGHADHIAGNKAFRYPVFIHEYDAKSLKNPMKNFSFFTGMMAFSPSATRLLKDNDRIEDGLIVFDVIHTPGHTPGGISLKSGNKIFTGDTLFREGVGRTDFPYANEKDLRSSIKDRLMIFGDEVEIFPGHGPSSTIGHERKHNPFIRLR